MDLLKYWNPRKRPFEPSWDTRFFYHSRDQDEALDGNPENAGQTKHLCRLHE